MRRLVPLLVLLLPLWAIAQTPVEPVTRYYAYVANIGSPPQQKICLAWDSSATPNVMGYHICTGEPCLDYDTVFGHQNTLLVCTDHVVDQPHVYRIHAFDSAYNVSALTPPFGPTVLYATVPQCDSTVHLRWTPYIGMPDGVDRYTLVLHTGSDSLAATVPLFSTDSTNPLEYTYRIPDTLTGWLTFEIVVSNRTGTILSTSNTASARRLTSDTAQYLSIDQVQLTPDASAIQLDLTIDTAYHAYPYTLYRRRRNAPWQAIDQLLPSLSPNVTYLDPNINPYDSIYCYSLGVLDGCGLNEQRTDTHCVLMPTPPQPTAFFPNIIIAGDPDNGTFLPVVGGAKGDLYDLCIYNRNGLLVFRTSDPQQPWDPLATASPQGAYVYSLRLRYIDNTIKTFAGTITVLK